MKKNFIISILATIAIILTGYLFLLPRLVSCEKIINFIETQVEKNYNAELEIIAPKLVTSIKPTLGFAVDKIELKKDNQNLLLIENFETEISFSKIFKKTMTLNKLGANFFFVDANKLITLFPQQKTNTTSKKAPSVNIDILNSLLYVKNCHIIASIDDSTNIEIKGNNLKIEDKRNPKFVNFHIETILSKLNEKIKITIDDNEKFYIKDKKLIIENCPLDINNSRINISSIADEETFTVVLSSNNFNISDGAKLISSNIFIPNGSELLAETQNIKGTTDFYININKNGVNGLAKIKNASLTLKSLANLPINVINGDIKISPEKICLENFKGYYSNSQNNPLAMQGTITDYLKSVDTKLIITTSMTDDFTRNYLSKVAGCLITMTGEQPAPTKIEVFSKYADVDVIYMAKLAKNNDILIEGASLSPTDYDRAIKADLKLRNNILNIESIKYYIAEELNKDSIVKPILTLHGNIDIMNNSNILNLGFNIPKPLPSEFLNVLIGQRLFKKGTISGNLNFDNTGEYPILTGNLAATKVIIPSLRLFIREGNFVTDKKDIKIHSSGKFRRAEYKFDGHILNKLLCPIIVKDIQLDLDNIDIEKLLNSFLIAQENESETVAKEEDIANDDTSAITFIPNTLVIENAEFNLKEGKYKEIQLGNLNAKATLDKDGHFNLTSNKFDFAEGISTAKVVCDLAKNKFWVRLGAKDINSDTLATALLNLKREISGKASGLIILETDSSLKLNGNIKFAINNGTIEKVGLLEYALNFVSIFRNPMAMLSPSLVFDIVNIPEGSFDKISGNINIKDNIIDKLKIESTAPQLATLIFGKFNLETRDASLRIYTKFANKDKGVAGVLRKLSLNSIANRVSLGNSNLENYYSAELEMLPPLDADEKDCQVYLTTVDGDVERNNFLSSLNRIK